MVNMAWPLRWDSVFVAFCALCITVTVHSFTYEWQPPAIQPLYIIESPQGDSQLPVSSTGNSAFSSRSGVSASDSESQEREVGFLKNLKLLLEI